MAKITKKYTNGEITVVWKPHLCVHATTCFTELPAVFIPYERPWINMKGATTEEIIDVVGKCPTDALSYFWNEEEPKEPEKAPSGVEINIVKNGPFIVKGSFKLSDTDGSEILTSGMASLCRCGFTENRPFCDGSHLKSDFKIDDMPDRENR